eukprot:2637089-Alexandrium_andersonii.AAC.1
MSPPKQNDLALLVGRPSFGDVRAQFSCSLSPLSWCALCCNTTFRVASVHASRHAGTQRVPSGPAGGAKGEAC